jgi:hypothetical protein
MANAKLAQILRISQHLTYQFYDINCDLSKAWHTFESARGNLSSLLMLYDEWLTEEKPSEPKKE